MVDTLAHRLGARNQLGQKIGFLIKQVPHLNDGRNHDIIDQSGSRHFQGKSLIDQRNNIFPVSLQNCPEDLQGWRLLIHCGGCLRIRWLGKIADIGRRVPVILHEHIPGPPDVHQFFTGRVDNGHGESQGLRHRQKCRIDPLALRHTERDIGKSQDRPAFKFLGAPLNRF